MATAMTDNNNNNNRDIGELNRQWFDSKADTAYKADWVRDLIQQISSFLNSNVKWLAPNQNRELRLLDYACGGGIVSATLAPYSSVVRGIDISGGMVDLYNDSARRLNHSPEKMRAVRGNLLSESEDLMQSELQDFDLIVMSMALHHVEDPNLMVEKLAERLKPGGSLVIIDWISHGKTPIGENAHPASDTITRHGFAEEEMREIYLKAGLVQFEQRLHAERSKIPCGGTQQLFFSRGTRRA